MRLEWSQVTTRNQWRTAVILILISLMLITNANPAHAAMTVTIRPIAGTQFNVSVDATDTSFALKQIIELSDGTPVSNQRLVFSGRQLQDANTLADYNIQNGSTVFLVRRLSQASSTETPPIPPWFQSYARGGASEVCQQGWGASWAEWPNNRTGGWTCDRMIPSLG